MNKDHFDRLGEIVRDRIDYNTYKMQMDRILDKFNSIFSEKPRLKEEPQIKDVYIAFLKIYKDVNAIILELNDLEKFPVDRYREIRRKCFRELSENEIEIRSEIIPKLEDFCHNKAGEEKYKEIKNGKNRIIEAFKTGGWIWEVVKYLIDNLPKMRSYGASLILPLKNGWT
jgi:hypothetical protein